MSSFPRSSRPLVCSLLAVLQACGATKVKSQAPDVLADAFTVFEKHLGQKQLTPLDRVLVDYESTIVVQPDIQKIHAIVGDTAAGGEKERAALTQAQDSAAFLGDNLTSTLQLIAENDSATREFLDKTYREGMVLQTDAHWRAMSARQKAIVDRLVPLAETYVSVKDTGGRWMPGKSPEALGLTEDFVDAAQNSVDELYKRLCPKPGQYDPAVVSEVTNALTPILHERLLDLERATNEAALQVEMKAELVRGEQRVPISIDPYVHVEVTGAPPKSARVGIPSREELERVKAAYDQYAKLAQALNDLRDLAKDKEALAKARDEVLDVIRKRIESLRTELKKTLEDLLGNSELAGIKALVQRLQKEVDQAVTDVQALVQSAPTSDPIALVDGVLSTLQSVKKVGDDLKELQTQLDALPANLSALTKELVKAAKEVLSKQAGLLLDDLEGLDATSNAAPVGALVSAFRELQRIAKLPGFGDLKPVVVATPFGLDSAPPGTVNLADTVAEPGDRLEIRQTVGPAEKKDASTSGATEPPVPPQAPTYHASQHLQVRKYGLYTTYNAQLLFYDRLHNGATTYSAAPGLYYNFHYRPEGGSTFFDTVAPGIGLSVSAPSFEDGTEIAVGAQVTILNDVLQFGYGRNLSVADDATMLFFGFDLIQAYREMK